ncbi:hypothetical protein V1478_012486 [Vespula squamosa]|uniref:Uncharacterized protein n=1 Tax=Vespula squamosa TaxID=30214 RepID=A0ABD2AFY8_VESSQ
MEAISFRFFPGESNYRSDQTSEGYRNGCDCRQASGHANGSLKKKTGKRCLYFIGNFFSVKEYLSNSNVIMAMVIKCLSSRQHQCKKFLYGSISESQQHYPLAKSVYTLNQ